MTEDGSATAGENGGQGLGFAAQSPVADCIHATEHGMQPAYTQPVPHRAAAQAQRAKLDHRDDSPLRAIQIRHPLVRGWTQLCTMLMRFCVHPASIGRCALPIYRRLCRLSAEVDPALTPPVAP